MPNNFLSSPFSPWVKKQVDVRQNALGKYTNISSKDLQYYTSKTPFLRVASSVNLTNQGTNNTILDNSVLDKLIASGYSMEDIGGDSLARNFILQGGVVSANQDNKTFSGLQKGLNDDNSIFNGAYGWGGSEERGYIPMPGITQADVTYYNNGALSKTVINVKCYSKAQFQLFDVLYLRPGYTLLMEFGWSQYLDNDGNLQSFDNFYSNPMSKLLGSDKMNQYQLYKSIEDERKLHNGNYDAVFGKISKFRWQFLPDGSYDCQIQLTAIGDVIESLKCNISDASSLKGEDLTFWQYIIGEPEGGDPSEPPLISNARSTIINAELFRIYQTNKATGRDPSLQPYEIKGLTDESGDIKTVKYEEALLIVPGTRTNDDNSESPQIFIKYGAFLAYLQSKILVYNTTTNTPLFTFDIDFDNIDNDDNVILTIPGQISSDPRVCLIPYSSTNIDGVTKYETSDLNLLLNKTKFNYKTELYLGRFTNIMVNINYLASSLAQTISEEGDITLLDFLKKVNAGIIESTGGINKFEYKLSDSGLSVKIIEDIPQRFQTSPLGEDFTRFNIYGVKPGVEGSFVRSVNLTADLSNDFASMISIGAQSNSNQASSNATSFSNYNAGLKDRIIEEKLSSPSTKFDGGGDKSEVKEQIWPDPSYLSDSMTFIYKDLSWVDDNINSFKHNNKQNASLMLGVLTDATNAKQAAQLQAPFFLPFNLSLEMDGLSGMKLYQKFLMTDDILPASYERDGVDLQLTGINHSITSDSWITKLETISVPAEKLGAEKRPSQQNSKATLQTQSQGSLIPQESETPTPPPINPDSIARKNAMQSSYTSVFNRDGAVSGMCAQWTYNLARNYVEYLEGRSISNKKLSAGGNANNNSEYYNNLTKLGYTKSTSMGISKSRLLSLLNTTTWGYGDVVAYWANDGDPSATHKKYGHTQIYVGDINSSKWSTSNKLNYGTNFPYRSRPSINWNYIVFRAPSS